VRAHADIDVRAGGAAVNAASAAVAAGASATVVGRIGRDAAGGLVLAGLAARGVGDELARDPRLPTGTAVALGSPPGVVASRGANAALDPGDVPPAIEGDALFVSGFALFQPGSDRAAEAAIERFPRGWIGVDLASPPLARAARGRLSELPAERTVVFATADEARALTGEEPEAAARTLAARGCVACVKLGADGALAASAAGCERRRSTPVERRMPFGAGDAFAGVFLVALAAGTSIAGALERACDAGARAAAGRGW